MTHRMRKILRWIIMAICVAVIVYCQRTTGKQQLVIMLVAVAGLLGVLYDYNLDYTKIRERLYDYEG